MKRSTKRSKAKAKPRKRAPRPVRLRERDQVIPAMAPPYEPPPLTPEQFTELLCIEPAEPVYPSTVYLPPYAPEFQALVTEELARARAKFGPMRSAHEAYGIIAEEFEEWWAEVKSKRSTPALALTELTQLAAMCQKAAEDVYGLGRGDV